jgi:acyl-CoA synthetase (AMP-forming)/AMP-acid ligase II
VNHERPKLIYQQGQAYFCLTAPRIGAKVYITSKFSMDGYMLYLDIYRITFMNAVPTIYNKMARLTNPAKYNLKAVENVTNGSAPLEPAIGQQVAAKFLPADTKVKQGWGMTETTCSVTGFAMDDEDDGRSIGWLHPNCSAKICPVPGRKVESVPGAKGAVGEIWVAGPNIMKGYWKKPRQTEDTFAYEDGERWLKTGDIGYVDQRGCIYIVDRLKVCASIRSSCVR